jgi:hypothetical protein
MPPFSIDHGLRHPLVPLLESELESASSRRCISLKRDHAPLAPRRWTLPSPRVLLAFLPLTCAVVLHGIFAALLAFVVAR